jgi:hypothetical protein
VYNIVQNMDDDYQNESWVGLYRAAMVELEHSKMSGRIDAARSEIAARIEKLRSMPGLHIDERQALPDALSGLRTLAEEVRLNDEQKRRLERTHESLRSIGPSILRNERE